MGVPVNEHIDAGDLGQQIHGAVTGGLIVNAQMPQADNIITGRTCNTDDNDRIPI